MNNHKDFDIRRADIIQDVLLIEEKTINFRKDDWFKPPIAPTIAEIKISADKIINEFILFINKISEIGAIFWIVSRTKQLNHDIPSITGGIHKWKGTSPSLINKADNINL